MKQDKDAQSSTSSLAISHQASQEGGRSLPPPPLQFSTTKEEEEEPTDFELHSLYQSDLPNPPPTEEQSNQAIQRKGPIGVGGEITNQGAKLEFSLPLPEKEWPLKWVTLSLGGAYKTAGELKAKHNKQDVATGGSNSGVKTAATIHKGEVKNETKTLAQLLFDEHVEAQLEDWSDPDYELITEGKEGGNPGEFSAGSAVKITFQNGHSLTVGLSMFDKSAQGTTFGNLNLSYDLPVHVGTIWENTEYTFVGSTAITIAGKASPNWSQIMADIAKRFGKNIARRILQRAATSIVQQALGAGGLIAGGVLTAVAYIKFLSDMADINHCVQRARNALEAYVSGWCLNWGIDYADQSEEHDFWSQGFNDAGTRMTKVLTDIMALPDVAMWGISAAEIKTALKAELPSHSDQVITMVRSQARMPIYEKFVIDFYHTKSNEILTAEHHAYQDAKVVAGQLGVDFSVIPYDNNPWKK